MFESDGLLLLPRLRAQNVNAISGPLSWGFPSPTAFLGFAHALERKLGNDWGVVFSGVGVICHRFDPQTSRPAGRHHQVFSLSRHPLRAGYKKFEDKDAALVEDGRAHMEVSLLLQVSGKPLRSKRDEFLECLMDTVHGMRLAGGSLIPSFGEPCQPAWHPWGFDEEDNLRQFRAVRRRLMPGFALVHRPDLLAERLAALRETDPNATVLNALLNLCALHAEPEIDDEDKVQWRYRRDPGWLVPVPVGYGALADAYLPGEVANARDNETPFRFVESLYSLGQWLSPHRFSNPNDLMWRYRTDVEKGLYLCANDYATTLTDKE